MMIAALGSEEVGLPQVGDGIGRVLHRAAVTTPRNIIKPI